MELSLMLLVNVFTSLLKKYVYPKWGKPGVHVVVFALSMLVALYIIYKDMFPSLENFVAASIVVYMTSVTVYETVLQYIPFFKAEEKNAPTQNEGS